MTVERKNSQIQTYQIKIKGRLDEQWADWFDPMTLKYTAEGDTLLVGPVSDQAALQGVLINLSNLNLTVFF